MEFLNFKERLLGCRLKELLCFVVLGLLLVLFFSGKSHIDLETIAVSPNEQYIACFETGDGDKIRCFYSDGSLAFDFDILPEISAGGYCTLWFEDDVLLVLFYRTDKVVSFSMDGAILKIADYAAEERPPEFPSFSKRGNQYIYDGDEIDVVYYRGSFLEYWLFGSERYLAITPKSGETKIVYAWKAKGGIIEKS